MRIIELVKSGILSQPTRSYTGDMSMILHEDDSDFKRYIILVSKILEKINIQYSLTGALAANFYSKKPRNTSDIDLLFFDKDKHKVVEYFEQNGFRVLPSLDTEYIKSAVNADFPNFQVDLMFVVGDPEESAIEMAHTVDIYNHPFKLMPGELLVWVLLLSNLSKHENDIKNILEKPKSVNINKLMGYLEYSNEEDAIKKLKDLIHKSSVKYVTEDFNQRMRQRTFNKKK